MRPSREAQNIDGQTWYYENNGSIDLIIRTPEIPDGHIGRANKGARKSGDGNYLHVRIPSRMLAATLERQGRAKPCPRKK